MNLYLVERTDRVDYDEYVSFICATINEERAKRIWPGTLGITDPHIHVWSDELKCWEESNNPNKCAYPVYGDEERTKYLYCLWADTPDTVKVTKIGTSDINEEKIIHIAFLAG